MMKPPRVTHFFLGANSHSGFYSLYDRFCTAPHDCLHIIKGGPGTGKSTFMRRIGNAAESHGLDVEYILCSGDPDSVDGVYIPALQIGWADGTAPHILEPSCFGTAAVYENLGQFCNTDVLQNYRQEITTLTDTYRKHYKNAYAYLNAVAQVRSTFTTDIPPVTEDKIRKRARSKIKRELSDDHIKGSPVKRFIRAISCHGNYLTEGTINSLCDRLCVVESNLGLEQIFFEEIRKELEQKQAFHYHCLDPLCPNETEAIILPDERLCFVSSRTVPNFKGTSRTIHLDHYVQPHRKQSSQNALYDQLMNAAIMQLHTAKQLHDELEAYYRPALDTDSLDAYANNVIAQFF